MTDDSGSRSYRSPLRERRARQTRRALLDAAARLIVDEGIESFSMREVARRADVSERTVYHHFSSRQALLDGLTAWVGEQLRARRLEADPRDIEHLSERIGAIFAAFDDIGAPARAMARLAAAEGVRTAEHRRRTEAFRERLSGLLDPLPEAEAEQRFAILRHLMGSTTWLALRDDFDLGGEDAAAAVAWALDTLLADLERSG